MSAWVPSVEPVSAITQASINGRTVARQRPITRASFLTIMFRQMVWPRAFIESLHSLEGSSIGDIGPASGAFARQRPSTTIEHRAAL